jgi:hypothetical protein
MKYDDKYPTSSRTAPGAGRASRLARDHDEPEPCIIRVDQERPCWNCPAPTRCADIDFAYLCSDECSAAKWRDFERACRGQAQDGKKRGPV